MSSSPSEKPNSIDDSTDDETEFDIWTVKRPKVTTEKTDLKTANKESKTKDEDTTRSDVSKTRFEKLQQRRQELKERSDRLEAKTTARKTRKLSRKARRERALQKNFEQTQGTSTSENSLPSTSDSNKPENQSEKEWKSIQKYIDVNKHLSGPVGHGWCGPKTDLEREIGTAISEGNFDKAEELSNRLANRDFGVKIHEAIGAKRYAEKQQAEANEKEAKRKKTLGWGFETKQRWEMKSNL